MRQKEYRAVNGLDTTSNKTNSKSSEMSGCHNKMSWVILLTTAISPIQGMTHTQRSTPMLRSRDYIRSLLRWGGNMVNFRQNHQRSYRYGKNMYNYKINTSASISNVLVKYSVQTLWPMVVVESSGSNLTAFRQASESSGTEADSKRDMEFLSFSLPHENANYKKEIRRGKGVAEYYSIQYALRHSRLIEKYKPSHIVKVTGRYFVKNLDEELHRFVEESSDCLRGVQSPILVTQSTPSVWTLRDGVLRSEVVGWQLGFEQWLFDGQDEATSRPMERILFERARILNETNEGRVKVFRSLDIDDTKNSENKHVDSL